MKKLLCVLFALSTLTVATAFGSDISIEIMGNKLESEVAPLIIENRTMVPVRAIFEGVGAEVNWNGETKTVTGTMADTVVTMTIDSNVASINGNEVTMDASPLIIDGRTYAPARYVAESFGYSVDWDSENKIVKINSENAVDITTEENTEATTEAPTETTTEQTGATNIKGYSGTDMRIGVDLPEGKYIVEPNGSRFAKVFIYEGIKQSTGEKINERYTFFGNRGIIEIDEPETISIENGSLIPFNDAEKADLSKNGVFIVGKDIEPGKYTFKRSEYCDFYYFRIYRNADMSSVDFNGGIEDYYCDVKLDVDRYIYKYGLDIYKDGVLISKYEPDKSYYGDYSQYNFSDVSSDFKRQVNSVLTDNIDRCDTLSLSSQKYSRNYIESNKNKWESIAQNDAERKYAQMALAILECHRNAFADGSNGGEYVANDIWTLSSAVLVKNPPNKKSIPSNEEYMKLTKGFINGSSFEECESYVNEVVSFYYGYAENDLFDLMSFTYLYEI